MVDSDPIGDAADTFIDALIAAAESLAETIMDAIGNFAGNFIQGDLTANAPAVLGLVIVMLSTGGILAYKIGRG